MHSSARESELVETPLQKLNDQGSKYRMHTCTNARKIRDVHVTFVTYMHCVHVEIFTQ